MNLYKCIILITLVFSQGTLAEVELSGSLGAQAKQLTVPKNEDFVNSSAGTHLDLKLRWKKRSWRFLSELNLGNDFISQDESEKSQLQIKNLYLEKDFNLVSLRFGIQTLKLDGPDLLNPADVVHSKNWIDPTRTKTLGSAGVSLSQEIDSWQWQIFYIPYSGVAILPGEKNIWWPREKRLPIESEDVELLIPKNVEYQFKGSEELDSARKNNLALVLQRKSENLEAQLLLYDGLAQDPFLLTEVTASLIASSPKQVLMVDSPVLLKPIYFRHQVLAATLLIPFESWSLRWSGSHSKPQGQDSRIPKEGSTNVLTLEKSFETSKGMVMAQLQYQTQKKQNKDQVSFLRSIFEEAVSLGMRVPWGEETAFILGGVFDQIGKSSLAQISMSRRLSDSWTVDIEGKSLQGPKSTLLGLYEKYDSYAMSIQYHW